MTTRPLQSRDVPALARIATASGFPYPDRIVSCVVAVNEADQPIMAVAAHPLVELYLYVDPATSGRTRLAALTALHDAMGKELSRLGYTEAHVGLPPTIAAKFGTFLERRFGWRRSEWPKWWRSTVDGARRFQNTDRRDAG